MYSFEGHGQAVAARFRAIAGSQLALALAAARGDVRDGRTLLLEARRRTRKLRALLRLVRPGFAAYAETNVALRDAALLLSEARDDEVERETLAQLAASDAAPGIAALAGGPPAPGMPGNGAELGRFVAALTVLQGQVANWTLEPDDADVLWAGFAASYRACRRAMRLAVRRPDEVSLHEWRKRLKVHAAHLQLLRRTAPEVMAARHDEIARLAEMLGQHHDLAVLAARVAADPARYGGTEIADGLIGRATARCRTLETELFLLAPPALATKPKALASTLRAFTPG